MGTVNTLYFDAQHAFDSGVPQELSDPQYLHTGPGGGGKRQLILTGLDIPLAAYPSDSSATVSDPLASPSLFPIPKALSTAIAQKGTSSMKKSSLKGAVILALLFFAVLAFGQTDSTLYVKNFKGQTVGQKLTAAMASCGPATTVPCILVIDPSLASAPAGTLPSMCNHCFLLDWRQGPPSSGAPYPIIGDGDPTVNCSDTENPSRFWWDYSGLHLWLCYNVLTGPFIWHELSVWVLPGTTGELAGYASNGSAVGPVAIGTGLENASGNLNIKTTGITAGTYANGQSTVNAEGQITGFTPGLGQAIKTGSYSVTGLESVVGFHIGSGATLRWEVLGDSILTMARSLLQFRAEHRKRNRLCDSDELPRDDGPRAGIRGELLRGK